MVTLACILTTKCFYFFYYSYFFLFYCEQCQIAEQETMLDPIAKANTKGLEQKKKGRARLDT